MTDDFECPHCNAVNDTTDWFEHWHWDGDVFDIRCCECGESSLKIQNVYGGDVASHASAVVKLTAQFFDKKFYEFSPQIKILEIGFSKGISVQENLNRSYERVVTFRGGHD
ncbi:hypothetical protein DJ533_00120 (plasmid) [Acinetobacter defluvii]|uniref:Uncharacterized protein n=1 Tax=Acinetobacter defluvii TaxID=1871111 RepID=A0A2S2F8H2_9GAMM|nr:hypothetical protein [Acinetobacter defluvii]AWL27125.1 hypothetical protein DJ533_00120 [Acinetobacter defluvii]